MKFEDLDRNGVVVMHTEHQECIPPEEVLKQMQSAGHKFKLDGKLISITKLKTLMKNRS